MIIFKKVGILMKKVKMKVNPRIIEHLGNDLITSASVAVVELIKNSIDAHSKRINVQFFDGVEHVKRNDKLLVPLDGDIASLLDEESSTLDILTLSAKFNNSKSKPDSICVPLL